MAETWTGLAIAGGVVAAGGLLIRRSLDTRPRGVPVLRYGLVGPPRAGSPLNDLRVPMSAFRAQIRHLARRGFRAVTVLEALAGRRRRSFLESNPVVISFDGPWQSFASAVWPVLAEHGMTKVTLCFPADRLGQDAVHYAHGRPEPLLTTAQLQVLVGDGVDLGLLSADDVQGRPAEVSARWGRERDTLADAVGCPVRVIALPYTRYGDAGFARAARAAGLQAALKAGGGGVLTGWSNRFTIPRYLVQPGTELIQVAYCLSRRSLL